jgi:SanA protein
VIGGLRAVGTGQTRRRDPRPNSPPLAFRYMARALLRRRRVRIIAWTVGGAVLAAALLVGALNAYVLLSESGESTDQVSHVPDAQVALVLGAYVEPNGHMSQMLADRVQRAEQLWRAGKVQRILVSGDHHTWSYDEPDTMRRALQAAGVPGRDIFTDHAGFNTWDSMVRARKVFGVHSAIVVTQGFHMPRALYLAAHAGLEAHGLTSDLHGYGRQGELSGLREVLARVKAVYQGTTGERVLLGPRVAITGDGRVSWGPQRPTT